MIGLLIAIAILGVLRSAVKQVGARLMDAVDPALLAQARAVMLDTKGVIGVRSVRLRWIGHTLHAEADVTIADDIFVETAHDIAHRTEERLTTQIPRLAAALIHVSPLRAHAPVS